MSNPSPLLKNLSNQNDSNLEKAEYNFSENALNCENLCGDNVYSITLDSASVQNEEEAKNHLREEQRDMETSTNAEFSDNATKNKEIPPLRNRSKKEKKKSPKKLQKQGKQSPSQNESSSDTKVKTEDLVQPEKPTVIKGQTLTLKGQDECELALSAYLDKEYKDHEYSRDQNHVLCSALEDVEYHLKLINPNTERMEHLTNQMKFRLQEGHGEVKYEIGVAEDGTFAGLNREEMLHSLSLLRI